MKYIIFCSLSCWLLTGCMSHRNVPELTVKHTSVPGAAVEMFLFTIYADSTRVMGERIELKQRQTIEGYIKQPLVIQPALAAGDLVCSIYDQQGRRVLVHVEEDPLTTPMEYPNEDGTLGRAPVTQASADLFIRCKARPDLARLTIEKIDNNNSPVLLYDLKL
jgi:hypothetical protein